MAITGAKRHSEATSAAVAKKRRTDLSDISKAVKQAKVLPTKVQHLLSNVVQHSLAVYSDERHEFQVHTVDMIGNALNSVQSDLQLEFNAAQAAVSDREGKKKERVQAVITAANTVSSKKQEAAPKEAFIVQQEMAFIAAKKVLEDCQKAIKVPARHHQEAQAKHAELQKVLDGKVQPLKEVAGSKKAIGDLVKLLKKFAVDESLLSTFPSVAAKAPAERGDFDQLAFSNLEKALQLKGEELAAGVDGARPELEKCQAALDGAKANFAAAKDALKKAKDISTEAEKEVHDAEQGLTKAKKGNLRFEAEWKENEAAVAKKRKSLEAFQAGPIEAFASLKATAKPLPPVPPEAPVVDDSVAADIS